MSTPPNKTSDPRLSTLRKFAGAMGGDAVGTGEGGGVPRFSLKQAMVSTAILTVGMAGYGYFFRHVNDAPFPLGIGGGFAIWFGCGALIGIGSFALFGRPLTGMFLGLLIAAVAFVVIMLLTFDPVP